MLTGKGNQAGFTYIGLLLFVAISGIALAIVAQVWHTEVQREKEKELLFVGEQYAKAINSYYENSPAGNKQYPSKLEDLILDTRFPVVRRHLRKLYPDPMTKGGEWGIVKQQERILGVYSLALTKPIKKENFGAEHESFTQAENYQQWKFTATAGALASSSDANAAESLTSNALSKADSSSTVVSKDSASSSSTVSASPKKGGGGYELCQAALQKDNLDCNASCGLAAGKVCQDCFAAAFVKYRACL